jgi:YHS domain-containing protein
MCTRPFIPGLAAMIAFAAMATAASSLARPMPVQDHGGHGQHEHAAEPKRSGDPYLLDVDAVTGKSLPAPDKQVTIVVDGREFRFATAKNAETFQAEPAKYIPAVDAKLIAQQRPFYPLETCVVSGADLGQDTVDFVYMNRLVRVSKKEHQATFMLEPTKYVAKLDAAAIERQKPAYPSKTCLVSGEELGSMGAPIDRVAGNRLVRFCCKGCLKDFDAEPLKFLAKLDGGAKAKSGKGSSDKAASYVCPMHADVVKDEPGRCSKCGMDLVKRK